MRNCVVTIVGQKGAGKTQIARRLLALSSRVIILDRLNEHDGQMITSNPERAIDYLAHQWRAPFRLVTRFRSEIATGLFLRYVATTMERCKTLPISLLVEEADFYASPQGIEPALGYLYNYGRHFACNLIAVARGDTDLHRSIVANSDFLVACRMHRFSGEMREKFASVPIEISQVRNLKTVTPDVSPVKGEHYVLYPDSQESPSDLFASWKAHQIAPPNEKGLDTGPT